MPRPLYRNFQARILVLLRLLARTKGLWLRGGLCLSIGFSFLLLEDPQSFDLRFRLRGEQSIDSRLVVLNISLSEWERHLLQGRSFLRPLKDFATPDDSFFWNEKLWERLLSKILKGDPEAVGVSFFFSPALVSPGRRWPTPVFIDPRLFWLARQDSEGRILYPFATHSDVSNTGLLGFRADEDRVVRKFNVNGSSPSLSQAMTQSIGAETDPPYQPLILNYRGSPRNIPHLSLTEVFSQNFEPKILNNKIILIGTSEVENHLLRTPMGDMNRAEILATQMDNLLHNRFIKVPPPWLLPLLLLLLLILAIWLMHFYPQSIAFVFLMWIATGWTAFSIWIFDTYYFWIPVIAPVAQIVVTYVIFLGYQLTLKENEAWRLEQEKKYLSEIEQLKNNFVSLISHDLKTPIAKIQAICDRLLAQHPNTEVIDGLHSLRRESTELHRYIQTILKMSRAESSGFRLNKEATDINEIIDNVVQTLTPLIQQKDLSVECDLEPIFSIELDSVLIHEVLLNLIENAIKYTPSKGKIHIRSEEIEGEIVVIVEDNGPGIPQAEHDKIFEKFYRTAEQEHTTKGTGLGLYLVKYFVELHGGRVFLESEEGQGTRIGFRLPTDEESGQVSSFDASAEVKA